MSDVLQGRAAVPVACANCGWDDNGTLQATDVWRHEYPPIPYVRIIRFDGDKADYDPPSCGHSWCPACGEELTEETVVERGGDDGS